MLRSISANLFAALTLLAITVCPISTAYGQTFSVLHSFTGAADGFQPQAGLIQDARGSLYGTTFQGGAGYYAYGVAYKLSSVHSDWVVSTLSEFGHDDNGYHPFSRLTFGPDVVLYGTTELGGNNGCYGYGCGTVFQLTPPANVPRSVDNPGTRTVLYRFSGIDGNWPLAEVIFDPAGNLFGTTTQGGTGGAGTVFELTRHGSQWTQSVLYNFRDLADGGQPLGGLVMDSAGNLYGTNEQGGGSCYCGVVFELSPSGGGWSYQVLHTFNPSTDGGWPYASLIRDSAGNLYGTTSAAGPGGGGTVFELSPSAGGWNFQVVYGLPEQGDGPQSSVLMDPAGNLYGTTVGGGQYESGSVFKLTPQNGGWVFTSLHDFQGGPDGQAPLGNLLMDADGNLYGTTSEGGPHGGGTAWEIAP